MKRCFPLCACAWLSLAALLAADHQGRVTFGGLPLPGATVTAAPASSPGAKPLVTATDAQGAYSFAGLAEGDWTIRVEMQCFTPTEKILRIVGGAAATDWQLTLLPLAEMNAQAVKAAPMTLAVSAPPASPRKAQPQAANTSSAFAKAEAKAAPQPIAQPPAEVAPELSQQAADGLLINGSTHNAANSPFTIAPAFGNFRKGPGSLYNGDIGLIGDFSALDARAYSLTGQNSPKPSYQNLTGIFSFGGPIRIPRVLKNGPNLIVTYQRTRNQNVSTLPGLMPTALERAGDFSALGSQIIDPLAGAPFPGNRIPESRISPQARALLGLYPMPNLDRTSRYNYQNVVSNAMHQDSVQARVNKAIGRKDQLFGSLAYQSTRSDATNLFGFLDTTDGTGINTNVNWRHALAARLALTLGYQFSRLSTQLTPFFAGRENVSGLAGISGNDQSPLQWGPPNLVFAGGVSAFGDVAASLTHNQTSGFTAAAMWNSGRHTVSFGADIRRQQFNLLGQQNPRGTYTFTGEGDFAKFLLGAPDVSAIAYGNADKYFRAWANDAFVSDDWRISPGLTVNSGLRWEYGSPITERYGRLVNLDLTPGFGAALPVLASAPAGLLTGRKYPDSLAEPDKSKFEPRIGLSWRPMSATSTVVRAGYGMYVNTSVYQTLAMQMAQQFPLSRSFSVQNTAATPLTLANGFNVVPATVPNTFAIDPDFRVGYAHNWQLSVQRDLPGAFVLAATYLGIKGSRGVQMSLPNTYPTGVEKPCLACPAGFVYVSSNGNSTRESGQLQLRRRLRNGLSGNLSYTWSKSIDDAALGGRNQGVAVIAQDWRNLRGERGLSSFDQRHLLSAQMQYSTGMGFGGSFASGRLASLTREWLVSTQISAGSGLPLTPVYLAAVAGTGQTGSIRPDYTGAPLYDAPGGLFLNPAAVTAPQPGHWGNAGRDSITGPAQFSVNASFGRTFRLADRYSLDVRLDSINALNHVTYLAWNTVATSAQFGLPTGANPMRSVQMTVRARF